VAALVCDSSYRSLRDTVAQSPAPVSRLPVVAAHRPDWPVADEVVYWMGKRGTSIPTQ